MSKFIRYLTAALATAVLAGCATGGGFQSAPNEASITLAPRAASVLQRQMSFPPDDRIPRELVASARCIAVFPAVVKAGFIIGGRRGKGLVSCRQPSGGWANAAPAIYTLTGASVGLQAGVKKSSVILLFMTRDSTQALRKGRLKLGAGLAVTAGPLGFNADITTAPSPVMAYVTGKTGLFAGVDLSGSRLSFSDSANARLYGDAADAQEILFGRVPAPAPVSTFVQALQQFAPAPMQ